MEAWLLSASYIIAQYCFSLAMLSIKIMGRKGDRKKRCLMRTESMASFILRQWSTDWSAKCLCVTQLVEHVPRKPGDMRTISCRPFQLALEKKKIFVLALRKTPYYLYMYKWCRSGFKHVWIYMDVIHFTGKTS